MMKHQTIFIRDDNGAEVSAQAPLIISASRATDVPAFYADWFFRRLNRGYVRWRNPFSGQDSYVSFGNTRFIVFWSKDPAPLLPYLPRLKERGIGCYIQFTLNDYEAEGMEPNVPALAQRTDTFRRLVDALGIGAVVWRFDPLILTDKINIDTLLDKIAHIANVLAGYTEKLVFSFADIESYKKVSRNLRQSGINYREWDEESMRDFASRLSRLNHDYWNFRLSTCAERIDLSEYGIEHNRCIALGTSYVVVTFGSFVGVHKRADHNLIDCKRTPVASGCQIVMFHILPLFVQKRKTQKGDFFVYPRAGV